MALDRWPAPVLLTIMNIVPFVGVHGCPCATQHMFIKSPTPCRCAKFAMRIASATSGLRPQSRPWLGVAVPLSMPPCHSLSALRVFPFPPFFPAPFTSSPPFAGGGRLTGFSFRVFQGGFVFRSYSSAESGSSPGRHQRKSSSKTR